MSMAAAGWVVVGQSEGWEYPNVTWWVTAGVVGLVIVVVFHFLIALLIGLMVAAICFGIAANARRRVIVVTYRPQALVSSG